MRLPWNRPSEEEHLSAHWFLRMASALYVSTFMIRASFAIMLIAFPVYIIGLKSYFLFGLVLSSSPLFELLTVLGLGAYIDTRGRKNVLLLGLLVGSLALFGLLLTEEAAPLFVINAFHGMSAAAILVSSLALLADYAPPERRGKMMGMFDFVNIFGWITGFGIGGLLIDVYRDNIGMTFVIAGVMGVVAFAYALVNIREPHAAQRKKSEISFSMIASVLKQRSVILLIAPWFIIYLLISTMLTFTSKAGTQELGLSGAELGLLLGGGGGVFLVTQVIYGHLSDKYGRTKIMGVGTIGIVGIMLTVGSVFLGAPAAVPPAANSMYWIDIGNNPSELFLLQSPYGLYVTDTYGAVGHEYGPPEGGFGTVLPGAIGTHDLESVVSYTSQEIEFLDLPSLQVSWVKAVHGATIVRPAAIQGSLSVLYLDQSGIHVDGPAVPSSFPAPPPIGEGDTVLDLGWGGGYAEALVSTPGGNIVYSWGVAGSHSVPVDPSYTSFVPGEIGVGLSLASSTGFAQLDPATGQTLAFYASPHGWSHVWIRADRDPPFKIFAVAFAPNGGGAVAYPEGDPSSPTMISLPSDLSATAWSYQGLNTTVFVGYAANGTLSRTQVDFTSGETVPLEGGTVLVTRESAQSVFSELTSIPVATTIGAFALMAGAFGPAALAGLTDVAQEDKRGTTMGLYSVVISTSMIVGPVVTGYLVDNYGGFGVMVFLAASAAAMALFMALRALDVRRAGGERALHAHAEALRGSDEEE